MVPNEKRKSYALPGAAFVLGMGVAFLAAWFLFRAPPPPPAPPEKVVTEEELRPFLAAVEQSDYISMRDFGEKLFEEGARLPSDKTLLAEYATNSFPPYTVYAFYSSIGPDSTRRVLLTVDDGDRVVSFLAEEMEVTR